MDRLRSLLITDGFAIFALAIALLLAVLYLWLRRRNAASLGLLLLTSAIALFGAGGLLSGIADVFQWVEHPKTWSAWVAGTAFLVLFGMGIVLIASGRWSAPAAFVTAAVLLLAAGGFSNHALSHEIRDAYLVLIRLEVMQPGWLLLLLLIPLLIYYSYRSLAGLGPVRRWVALGLRSLLILLLALALAEIRLRHSDENVTVLFLVDRSLSIPEEHDMTVDPKSPQAAIDLRWERIKKFINEAVEKRGIRHDRDKAGVIVFGKRPRLELPPSAVPRFNLREVTSTVDPNYTDIAAAIKLALASFPEGSAKRIVLISDGNENLGNAEEQARIAKQNGAQIDIVPLAAGQRNENEVLVQSVEAPTLTEQASQLPIRVLIRSYNPNTVQGILKLWQVGGGKRVQVKGPDDDRVFLRPGLNSFTFKHRIDNKQESYTYEAIFEPERVLDDKGEVLNNGLQGDRVQNNRASTHVIALGRRRILLIEAKAGEHDFLVERLRKAKDSRFNVHTITPDDLPQNRAEMAVFLSNYDCVILANVPASDVQAGNVDKVTGTITEEQQEVLRSNTYDQGCGLIMIGGDYGFGAGGWQGTPVEKALPVDCDIKSLKITGKGGLVLIMHACEMSDGNLWEKKIAQLALKKLSANDEFGVIQWNGTTTWHIDLQPIGDDREKLSRKIDRMTPSDMPEFDSGLKMAHQALTEKKRDLATKHVIIISDGDPAQQQAGLLQKMKDDKVTVTTVGVATHGAPSDQNLANIARSTGGRFYNVRSPKALPAIYTKESRIVSQAFIYKKAFRPKFDRQGSGPTEGLPDPLALLHGFVRTTPKQSTLYNGPILGPSMGDQEFPVLAYWQYGLGKSAAFTSDARKGWDRDWAAAAYYDKFWEQLVGWACRSVETGRLSMTTEYRDGKIKVILDARDNDGKMLTDLNIKGGATPPGGAQAEGDPKVQFKFDQTRPGIYVAEFKADEAGSYFINAQSTRKVKRKDKDGKDVVVEENDGIRAGVTIPYSPEFADMESNTKLLKTMREITGGREFSEAPEALDETARSGDVFRYTDLPQSRSLQPIWYWLMLATAILLLFDIAIRRIAIDPLQVTMAVQRYWERLRGQSATATAAPQFLDRLKSRKAAIGETLGKTKAQARFESGAAPPPSTAPTGADEAPAPGPSAAPRPLSRPGGVAPDAPQEQPADYASRLMKAKKRVWEDRDKKE
jgi:uncharacterized membrane protein/Mg-chelatase subunit ChlD